MLSILFTTSLFFIGLFGIILNNTNIIAILMSIELMLLAINLNFLVFSYFYGHEVGIVFALMILTVAAAESAIGLAKKNQKIKHRRYKDVLKKRVFAQKF
jgi:NADH-quinone oxidoreductase subunit K